jgi:ribosomal protein S18 acetylase RimI-like enzyme
MTPLFAPRNLLARPVTHVSPEYREILTWEFSPTPFYVAQVARAIRADVTQLLLYQDAVLWVFAEQGSSEIVGFGTLMISEMYAKMTGGLPHFYIPLLSAKPGQKGCGKPIVKHLMNEAAIGVKIAAPRVISSRVFLDVYVENVDAINSYRKSDFEILNKDEPLLDEGENNSPYYVMARNVEVAGKKDSV